MNIHLPVWGSNPKYWSRQRSQRGPAVEASWQTHWPVRLSQMWPAAPAAWQAQGRQPVALPGETCRPGIKQQKDWIPTSYPVFSLKDGLWITSKHRARCGGTELIPTANVLMAVLSRGVRYRHQRAESIMRIVPRACWAPGLQCVWNILRDPRTKTWSCSHRLHANTGGSTSSDAQSRAPTHLC